MNKDTLKKLRSDGAISEEVLLALLKVQGNDHADALQLVEKAYRQGKPDDISEPHLALLEETLRFPKNNAGLKKKNWFDLITDGLSYFVFAVIFSVFIWLIIDSQSRASLEFGFQPLTVILIVSAIVFFIALLEGSQIAIVNLSDQDISHHSDAYPIAYEIQKLTRSRQAIQDYLVGRQLLVVSLVIVFSLLTSFPDLTGVGNYIEIPKMLDLIAFKLGLLNALVLLWFGQLIPQLFASKAPLSSLNASIVKYVVYLCIYISRFKIAKPSSFIVDLADVKEHKPRISAYDEFVHNLDLYRHYQDSYSIVINYADDATAKIEARKNFVFCGVVNRLVRRTLGIYGKINRHLMSDVQASRADGTQFQLLELTDTEPNVKAAMQFYSDTLEPRTSTFHAGDRVEICDQFELSEVDKLEIRIERPVRVLFIKCQLPESVLAEGKVKIPDLKVNFSLFDEASEKYRPEKTISIIPERQDGFVVASYACVFPAIKSALSLDWKIQ